MEKRGINQLILYSNAWFGANFANVYYASNINLSHVIPRDIDAFVIIGSEDPPTVVLSDELDGYEQESWIKDVKISSDAVGEIARVLGERRISKAGIGIVGEDYMSKDSLLGLRQLIPKDRRIDANGIVDDVWGVKSPREIEIMTRSQKIAESSMLALIEMAKPGMKVCELQAEVDYQTRRRGGWGGFVFISGGKEPKTIGQGSNHILQKGDKIIWENCMGCDRGYQGEIGRTVILGKPSAADRKAIEIAKEFRETCTPLLRPGTPLRDIFLKQKQIITSHGYGQYFQPPFMRVGGHGLGIDAGQIGESGGVITENSTRILEPGWVLALHYLDTYIPGVGFFMLADPFVITQTGHKRLTSLPPHAEIKEAN